ncbi:hypothetical protein ABT269_33345 [Streptomyces viridosporus]|uniref:hypothetical protein n=1 Tax=Streptomyces viridosporus TaxID=67581 RepID=UPI00332BE8C9
MRSQDATLERLRVDRQLEEALTHGPDPLHLAEVFGLDEKTAMRYADSARALLEQAAEHSASPSGKELARIDATWSRRQQILGRGAGAHPRLQESSRRC